jgi:isocitrate dehydrogenase
MPTRSKIIYTFTDEAPALATYSLLSSRLSPPALILPLRRATSLLAGRILASFPEQLGDKAVADHLAELGALAVTPEANIIKLPNISASVPQLQAAIKELQARASTSRTTRKPRPPTPRKNQGALRKVKGSAVNPVLREGNSDRRAPLSVKNYARKHPHKMGAWAALQVPRRSHEPRRLLRQRKSCPDRSPGQRENRTDRKDGTTTVLKEKTPYKPARSSTAPS